MIIILILFGIMFGLAFIAFLIGTTLRDIQIVRLERAYRQHPYARQFRERPLVSIVIDGEPSDACLKSIRHGDYNKIQIVTNGQTIDGDFILTLSPDTRLERTAISRAVRELNSDPRLGLIELLPALRQPQSTPELFRAYRHIAASPFMAARAGLHVTLPHSSAPTLMRLTTHTLRIRTRLYLIGRWLVQIIAILSLVYTMYLAIMLYQPEFLLIYLAVFGVWLIWAIVSYRHFSLRQKLIYLALAPASIVSFLYLCIRAPLRFMQYVILLPTRHRDGIIALIEM